MLFCVERATLVGYYKWETNGSNEIQIRADDLGAENRTGDHGIPPRYRRLALPEFHYHQPLRYIRLGLVVSAADIPFPLVSGLLAMDFTTPHQAAAGPSSHDPPNWSGVASSHYSTKRGLSDGDGDGGESEEDEGKGGDEVPKKRRRR